AVQASATVPYISRPVVIGGTPYLDGGCAVKIPYEWAREHEKSGRIVVVKTRDRSYRREEKKNRLARAFYARYPAFVKSFEETNGRFNRQADELEAEERAGRVFIMAPSQPVTISRFEGDMQKLGDLYWLGYHDMEKRADELKAYLGLGG
ncbi:MAG: patatin family protein, partial [Oscillospiraceae bacterium]|nr:patatin family protein [Oscillospiraceae bacterium]